MNNKFDELKEKLNILSLKVENQEDKEKISVIKGLFINPNCFFDIDINTAINILSFLGIEDNNIMDFYYELIKPQNYTQIPTVMTFINKER